MKKTFLALVVVVVVIVAGYLYRGYDRQSDIYTISNTYPKYFPTEIIHEAEASNIEVVSDAGKLENEKHRASISYVSWLPLEVNKARFENALVENGFEVTQTFDTEDSIIISAVKGNEQVGISIWDRTPVEVSVLYIILK